MIDVVRWIAVLAVVYLTAGIAWLAFVPEAEAGVAWLLVIAIALLLAVAALLWRAGEVSI